MDGRRHSTVTGGRCVRAEHKHGWTHMPVGDYERVVYLTNIWRK